MKKYDLILLGGDGFIGNHFYLKYKHKISIFRVGKKIGDLKKKNTWKKIPKAKNLLNLASRVFVPNSWNEIDLFIDNNVKITLNSLAYCKINNVKNIYISSYLYGNCNIPTKESEVVKINNPYSLSKKMGEDLCKFYSEYQKVSSLILRPFNIYGPNQDKRFLIPSIINQVNKKKIIINDIRPARDLLYVDDFCELLFKSLNFKNKFSIYNVGSGHSYSVKEIINNLKNIIKKKDIKIVNLKKSRQNEILKTQADIKKVCKNFNWKPKTKLTYGLKKIINEKSSY